MHSSKGRSQEAKARCCVENSRPEAAANSPSSTPRQRQIKLGAASSLGQLADAFWLVGHTGLVFHTGAQAAAAASLREGGE